MPGGDGLRRAMFYVKQPCYVTPHPQVRALFGLRTVATVAEETENRVPLAEQTPADALEVAHDAREDGRVAREDAGVAPLAASNEVGDVNARLRAHIRSLEARRKT